MFLRLLLILLTFSSHTQVCLALKELREQWAVYRNECIQSFSSSPPATGLVCNRTFDHYTCWPDGLPGSIVNVSCPWYLPWYHKVKQGKVYRVCGADGRWADGKNTTECDENDVRLEEYWRIVSKFRVMYTVGYSLSLAALVLALGILAAFRKLHCMRNNIHMNLFGSFILRAVSILVKDALLDLINTQTGQYHNQDQSMFDIKITAGCRVAMVMMQYSVIANNYWLLVEGLYLHSLLVITVFSERNYFYVYLCIGWGAPVIFVLPWVTLKYLYENDLCWEKNVNMGYWWIIRSPILFAYLINFFIFIRIIKILMSKLKAHQMRYTDYKFRLAKSTLTLIPLLGIHAILFTFVIDESVDRESLLRLIRLFYDLFFSSFQVRGQKGLLVAILYCFVNKEVQNEMLKRWKRWKLGKDIEEEYRNTHSQTAHGKGASGNMPLPPERSDTPDSAASAPPAEESRHLVVICQNGARLAQGISRAGLQEGTSNCSSLTEDICLEERIHNTNHPVGTEECDV
ncbi:glucagon receptor isoform X1 [Tachysurus fulvidraco]|uniref:glucagon receptor isoform X1 n=1 Tax=Tachysurus fulvidraco TaxID=1234273 RepID=UPI001FED4312|nr:glucagon receptor isoform X1 [Tachysurus fulvidraco]XP_047659500.1 glucagon receptor isoform X1 [Tachysurus fulvidraco]